MSNESEVTDFLVNAYQAFRRLVELELRALANHEFTDVASDFEKMNTGNVWWMAYESRSVILKVIEEERRIRSPKPEPTPSAGT